MSSIEETLLRLNKSKFRSGFHLSNQDKEYITKVGLDTIRKHANDFVESRLSDANPKNDGAQTPWKGHPVFKAQHATACCCRGCLEKWYKVKKGQPLTAIQKQKIVNLLMSWIEKEYNS